MSGHEELLAAKFRNEELESLVAEQRAMADKVRDKNVALRKRVERLVEEREEERTAARLVLVREELELFEDNYLKSEERADELRTRVVELEGAVMKLTTKTVVLRGERDDAQAFYEGQSDKSADLQQSLFKRDGELDDLQLAARRLVSEVREAGEKMMGENARLAMRWAELEALVREKDGKITLDELDDAIATPPGQDVHILSDPDGLCETDEDRRLTGLTRREEKP